jgi:hypothetical protein
VAGRIRQNPQNRQKQKKTQKRKNRETREPLREGPEESNSYSEKKFYNGSESVRTFKCETGSSCTPDSTGNEIIVTFGDGKKGRIESYEIEKTKE